MSTPDHNDGVRKARRPARRRLAGRRACGSQLTPRDLEILRWITRHGVVTAELVGRRFFWRPKLSTYGQWAAYRRLRARQTLGLLKEKPFAHRPAASGEIARERPYQPLDGPTRRSPSSHS